MCTQMILCSLTGCGGLDDNWRPTAIRGENTGGVWGVCPPTEKTWQFAGQLNPFAGHKFSLTVAHSAYRCCHGACEAPGKIAKVQLC